MQHFRATTVVATLAMLLAAAPGFAQPPSAARPGCLERKAGGPDTTTKPPMHAHHGAMTNSQTADCVSSSTDSASRAFAGVQLRGTTAMGVDQYTSTHRFDTLPDGGRIELQRNVDDSTGVADIRTHLQAIAKAFKTGDFTTPAFVHMQTVPGTLVMAANRASITYVYRALARGGELRLSTTDAEALRAIHQFIAFQRDDHRAH